MKIVVDTSILIDYFRGGKKWQEFLVEVSGEAELFLPTIVIFEIFAGKSTKNVSCEKAIIDFLNNFKKIDLSEKIAKRAGELYRDVSKTLQVPDYVVAASALEIGGILLTLNRKHFREIQSLQLYPLS